MPDKADLSHIEKRVFVSPDVSPGSSLRWGSWEDSEERARSCGNCYGNGRVSDRSWRDARCEVCRGSGRVRPLPLTIIESGSDYSGCLYNASNARCLKRDFPWLVELHGGHGTYGVAYLGKREHQNPRLIEAIDALSEYPVYDEDDHSELEHDAEDEAWSDHGAHDFVRALVPLLDTLDPEHAHDSDEIDEGEVWDLWIDGCNAYNVNGGGAGCANEQGDSIHFYIREWVQRASEDENPRYPWSDYQRGARVELREKLQTLAHVARSR